MSEEKIKGWIVRQFKDKDADPSEMENWLLENSENPYFDTIMQELLDDVDYYDPVDSSRGYSLFKAKIKEYEKRRRKENAMKVCRWVERVAAVLLVPAAFVMFHIGGRTSDVEWLEANTIAGQKLEILLPDGSDVTLGPSSKIIYPSSFGPKERKIFVLGSVYADIAKDEKKPFVISAGDLDVVVLGTEFQLTSYEADTEVEIALVEGAVQLHNRNDKRDVFMRPGEIVCYDKTTGNFIRKNFAAGYYRDIIEDGGFHFVNQRLCDIASCLERHFGVTIHIDNDTIRNERYFASFINNESVDEILAVLNAQNYMKITRNGKIINITNN